MPAASEIDLRITLKTLWKEIITKTEKVNYGDCNELKLCLNCDNQGKEQQKKTNTPPLKKIILKKQTPRNRRKVGKLGPPSHHLCWRMDTS